MLKSDIGMNKMEKEPVVLLKPNFYKRYVDNTITKWKKNTDIDQLFHGMNSHYKAIKLTVETSPARFLDMAFSINLDGFVTTNLLRKLGKLTIFWNS